MPDDPEFSVDRTNTDIPYPPASMFHASLSRGRNFSDGRACKSAAVSSICHMCYEF
jgi:hypothetical protein